MSTAIIVNNKAIHYAPYHDDYNGVAVVDSTASYQTFSENIFEDFILDPEKIARPVVISKKSMQSANFIPTRININDIDRESINQQIYRPGRNEKDHLIAAAMRDEGVNVLESMPILAKNNKSDKWIVLAGHGRLRSLMSLNFVEILAWCTESELTPQQFHEIGLGSNDHLPQTDISENDVVHAAKIFFLDGGISGINPKQAKQYKEDEDSENDNYVRQMLERWIKTVCGKSIKEQGRNTILTRLEKELRNEDVVDIFTVAGQEDIMTHLEELERRTSDFPIKVGNYLNPIVAMATDGTRKPEAILGAIITAWGNQLVINSEKDIHDDIDTMNVVLAPSKMKANSFASKMNTVWKMYSIEAKYKRYTNNICKFLNMKGNRFHLGKPNTSIAGFINPLRQLEKYGWPYKGFITFDKTRDKTFGQVLEAAYKDNMFKTESEISTYRQMAKAYKEEFGSI